MTNKELCLCTLSFVKINKERLADAQNTKRLRTFISFRSTSDHAWVYKQVIISINL